MHTDGTASEEADESECASFWNASPWIAPLRQFSLATTMCVSAYDASARRRIGPFIETPLGSMLDAGHHWEEGGAATRMEQAIFKRTRQSGRPKKVTIDATLLLASLPVTRGNTFLGAIVFGWTMANFADPIACATFARRFRLQELGFWQVARQLAPFSSSRLRVCSKLLRTLVSSIIYQVTTTEVLERSSRAKDTFLATVSHELKTPLTSIILRTQSLLRSTRISHERDLNALQVIQRSAAAQQKLIEDLLDASRSVTGKLDLEFCCVDLTFFLTQCIEVVSSSAAEKSIALVCELGVEPVQVYADAARLQQVFWNLLNNAIKFTPRGGRVHVRLALQSAMVTISITDTGRGIDTTFLPFVFERFAQADIRVSKAEQGLGLGLALSKHLVEGHGGKIEARSCGVGKGATFMVTLPVYVSPSTV